MTSVKNLGQVRAIHIGSIAPTNTAMLWRDTNIDRVKEYNFKTHIWELLGGGGGVIEEDIPVTVNVGGYSATDLIENQTSLTEFVKKLVNKTQYPALQAPSFALNHNQGLREVNENVNVLLTYLFNRGAIQGALVNSSWNGGASQGPRAGAASKYTFLGVINGESDSIINTSSSSASYTVQSYVVKLGENAFGATVNYEAGPQPKDSIGEDFSSPLPAGSKQEQASFEGVYPLFASSESINVPSKQPLYSLLNANGIELSLAPESGGNKQFFDIPVAWLSRRALTSVYMYNVVSQSFDSSTNMRSLVSMSDVTHTVQGISVAYKRFTNMSEDRGSVRLKLIF